MPISEPVTMLTDYALGAVNLSFALFTLFRITPRNRVTGLLLGLGFLAGATSALVGGTFHGFAAQLGEPGRRLFWNATLLSIGAMAAFLGSGIHAAAVRRPSGPWIISAVFLTVIGLGIQLTGFGFHQDFNHNDIFHVLQIVAMSLFFNGARHLEDRAGPAGFGI